MDKLTDLYLWMQNNDVFLINCDMVRSQSKAATMKMSEDYAVLVDYRRIETLAEELCTVAHEYGHVVTGAMHSIYSPLDLISRHEYRADKKSVFRLIPWDELKVAFNNGFTEIWELAEYFGVTEDFIKKTLIVYTRNGNLLYTE